MARKRAPVIVDTNPAVNPTILGADLGDALWVSVGLAATSVGNDRVVAPFVKNLIPQLYSNETVGKIADSATTFVVAALLGELVGRVNRPIGHRVHFGGAVLAGGKLISVVLPGFKISGELPLPAPSAPAPALPAAQSGQSSGQAQVPALVGDFKPRNPGL